MSEDGNLDDFFAKKDKVKKKSNKTRITPDDIGQMLEKKLAKGAKKATGDKSKLKSNTNFPDSHVLNVKVDEDDGEWKEVEKEEEKDFSNLKIQSLNISAKVDAEQDSNGTGQSDAEEGNDKKDGMQGPWKSIPGPVIQTPPEPATPVEERQSKELPAQQQQPQQPSLLSTATTSSSTVTPSTTTTTAPKQPAKYVPPAARQQNASAATPSIAQATTTLSNGSPMTSASSTAVKKSDEELPKSTGKYVPPAVRQAQAAAAKQQQEQQTSSSATTTAASATTSAAKPAAKYVPPFMRQGAASSQQSSSSSPQQRSLAPMSSSKKKKTAPNVNSVEDFPTLE